ncbi:MAG: hypothetical protein KA712_20395 [Myxococcales bacterium]|nr:hypothetical protein [Myxococcales bacterium]
MTTSLSSRLYFSEPLAVTPHKGLRPWEWFRSVEIDPHLNVLKGPRWVYAFRWDNTGFSLDTALEFDEEGALRVHLAGHHMKSAPALDPSGRVWSVSLPTARNGKLNLWMFVTARFQLDSVCVRELAKFSLGERLSDGSYFAVSPFHRDVRLPVADLSSKPIPNDQRKRYHTAGSVFESSDGSLTVLAFDMMALAMSLKRRAVVALQTFLAHTQPGYAPGAKQREEVELRTLKLTLARFLNAFCTRDPKLSHKLSSFTAASGFIEKCEENEQKLRTASSLAFGKLCAFIESEYFDLWVGWYGLIGTEIEKLRELEEMAKLLESLEMDPRGWVTLSDPPEHFRRLLDEDVVMVDEGPVRKPKDYASFSRKHVKQVVEFRTKFVPAFIARRRISTEFSDIRLFFLGNVEPKYSPYPPKRHPGYAGTVSTVFSPKEIEDLKKHLDTKFKAEAGAESVVAANKAIGKAVDVVYWTLIIEDFATKGSHDIYDYAKATGAVNGALKTFVWEPLAANKKVPFVGPKGEGILAEPYPEKWARLENYLDEWKDTSKVLGRYGTEGAEQAAESASGKAAKVAMRKSVAKAMLKAAPVIGAIADFFGAHGDYTKSAAEGDEAAAYAGAVGGVLSGLGGLVALVPASAISGSTFLAICVPGLGWALLVAAAAAGTIAWVYTDSEWENFVEHTVFGKRYGMEAETRPAWAMSKYGEWRDTIDGLRKQIMAAYSLMCRFEIKGRGQSIKITMGHYEAEMTLNLVYRDSMIGGPIKMAIPMLAPFEPTETPNGRIIVVPQVVQGRLIDLTVHADWSGLLSPARDLVRRELEVTLRWSPPWSQEGVPLTETPVGYESTIEVRRNLYRRMAEFREQAPRS